MKALRLFLLQALLLLATQAAWSQPLIDFDSSITAYLDSNASINVILNNEVPVKGFQFDIEFPDSFAANITNKGDTDHSITINRLSGNKYRVLAYSLNNSVYKIGTDTAAVINFYIPISYQLGMKYITINNSFLSGVENNKLASQDKTIEMVVKVKPEIIVQHDTVYIDKIITDTLTVIQRDSIYIDKFITDTVTITKVDTAYVDHFFTDTLTIIQKDSVFIDRFITDTVTIVESDTVYLTDINKIPVPEINIEGDIVTMSCNNRSAIILYTLGDDNDITTFELYKEPIELKGNYRLRAIAVLYSTIVEKSVTTGVINTGYSVASRTFYDLQGNVITEPITGTFIIGTLYEDGSKRFEKVIMR